MDGGGAVIAIPCDGQMPHWQARGVLTEAIRYLDVQADT
jgi:hypothetical protein